ncbi:uncharacterized N-acetyltransferase p20-like [Impatiens glandulifera]|uniref:uncharacterized N-acetyltransferase p20-like n=1 Tax=Impatiens glandulifera TaxID=253017 RepID=UPI001FB08451|nr:uncharacterized N-acetyltransferase p20-like [Impatiens glandulifera]
MEEEASVAANLLDLTLRPFELTDVDDFMVWATDDRVTRFCSWDTYTSIESAVKCITENILPHPWIRAICLKNRPVGSISVTPNKEDKFRGEIGYTLAADYWGRGIATAAVKMAVKIVFREWVWLERLEALVDVENWGSQRVLEKSGFEKEGVLRKFYLHKGKLKDMVMFSLLRS